MKKLFCLCMAVFMVTAMTVVANAVKIEKEQYTIDLPDNFTEVEESKFIGDKNENLSVNIEENTKLSVCVADMSQKQIPLFPVLIRTRLFAV